MAKIKIHVTGTEPAWFQSDDLDGICSFLSDCGYSDRDSNLLVDWSLSPEMGIYVSLPNAAVHKERGNIETWDYQKGNWVPSPPEMEAFLADLRAVCEKHGLSILADNEAELLVQPYCESNISLLEAAQKDYEPTNIKQRISSADQTDMWEHKAVYFKIGLPTGLEIRDFYPEFSSRPVPDEQKRYWKERIREQLDLHCKDGWELVFVRSDSSGKARDDGYAFFKRLLEE